MELGGNLRVVELDAQGARDNEHEQNITGTLSTEQIDHNFPWSTPL